MPGYGQTNNTRADNHQIRSPERLLCRGVLYRFVELAGRGPCERAGTEVRPKPCIARVRHAMVARTAPRDTLIIARIVIGR